MFREGMEGLPPVLDPELIEKGEKNMEKPKLEVVGSKEEERDLDVGDLQVGAISPEEFVQRVLKREGGDSKKVEGAARALKFSWLQMLEEGRMSPEQFQDGVYDAVAKMLKSTEGPSAKEKEKEAMREERRKDAWKKRAA